MRMPAARITVTLPPELVAEIDRRERNRSCFVLDAVRRELHRRRREDLQRSLQRPNSESGQLPDAGLPGWDERANETDSELLDLCGGRPVRWVEGRGWANSRI